MKLFDGLQYAGRLFTGRQFGGPNGVAPQPPQPRNKLAYALQVASMRNDKERSEQLVAALALNADKDAQIAELTKQLKAKPRAKTVTQVVERTAVTGAPPQVIMRTVTVPQVNPLNAELQTALMEAAAQIKALQADLSAQEQVQTVTAQLLAQARQSCKALELRLKDQTTAAAYEAAQQANYKSSALTQLKASRAQTTATQAQLARTQVAMQAAVEHTQQALKVLSPAPLAGLEKLSLQELKERVMTSKLKVI